MISRVHWLLWYLSPSFKGFYRIVFNYNTHSYLCYRNNKCDNGRSLYDVFLVVRTSKRCFRMMYCDTTYPAFVYRSFRTSADCASFMEEIYQKRIQSSFQ